MSRILRRPMFRGGRVDSRGKGIASGLSYNKGGRVGYDYGGGVFPVGGKMHRFSESPLGGGIMYGIPGALADFFYTPANQIGRMFGFNPGWSARKDIREQKDYLFGEDREGRMTDEEVDVSNFFLPFSAKSWKDEVADQKEKEKKEEGPSTAEIIAQIKAEEKAKRDALIKEYTKEDTPDEAAAEIEKKKEIFQKAYGSGIADDASNMLLNFAGKALKEGATTKSAFGEFFEEEGKRPSERKKYKDAATTAAINAYLTGQKTLAETEAFMNKTNWQLNQQAALKKAANDPSNLDWTDRRTYYMTSIKGNNRDSGKVIRMSLQDEKSEKGKQIFETKDTEWITNPTEAAEMDDGLYIVTPKKGPKRIFEIKEGIVIDRSSDFPL